MGLLVLLRATPGNVELRDVALPLTRRVLEAGQPKHMWAYYDAGAGKSDADYQKNCPRRILEFPTGSCWLGITDLVSHGALSGQHSIDQNFLLPPSAMSDPSRSSLGILERLTGRSLA